MEIFVWKAFEMVKDRLGKLVNSSAKLVANRRASRKDRRQSINDGVIVTLSTRQEKRHNRDRRQNVAMLERFSSL